ncbi:MAG: hypothetical protein Q8R07_03800 [Candidatus Uhrbacteria bacterium]|nr:hypothetical protein [Candidatus Uhrbacteria bacterium]
MPSNFLLQHLPTTDTPPDLLAKILQKIQRARLHQLSIRMVFVAVGLFTTSGYAFSIWQTLLEEMHTSSFFELIRLGVSDPDVMLVNIKDFIFGLLEALPSWTLLAASLGLFFLIGMVTLAQALRSTRRTLFTTHHL